MPSFCRAAIDNIAVIFLWRSLAACKLAVNLSCDLFQPPLAASSAFTCPPDTIITTAPPDTIPSTPIEVPQTNTTPSGTTDTFVTSEKSTNTTATTGSNTITSVIIPVVVVICVVFMIVGIMARP